MATKKATQSTTAKVVDSDKAKARKEAMAQFTAYVNGYGWADYSRASTLQTLDGSTPNTCVSGTLTTSKAGILNGICVLNAVLPNETRQAVYNNLFKLFVARGAQALKEGATVTQTSMRKQVRQLDKGIMATLSREVYEVVIGTMATITSK